MDAVNDLDRMIVTHSLPSDTRLRVRRSLRVLEQFPRIGRQLEGRWEPMQFILGPWRWMLIIYSFEEPDDLDPVLREFVKATDGPLYLNFSGVEFYGPGESRLTPIKRGLVRFDPLAELLAERDYDVSVISSSPLLEHDAMYMKLLYERALARRWTKLHPSAAKPGARAPLPPPEKARRPGTAAPPEKARPAGARPPARPAPRARPHPMPKAVKRKPPAKGGDRGRRRRH